VRAHPNVKVRWWLAAALASISLVIVGAVASQTRSEQGFLAPIFSRDGSAVFVIVRQARATVLGLGFDNLTPPADVWIHTDRFTLQRILLTTGRVDIVEQWRASPLEGAHIREYRGRVFGVPHAHLRWADDDHLEYEVGVTRPAVPGSGTFVVRRTWDARHRTWMAQTRWAPGAVTMGGDEPEMLAGEREVIAVPGRQSMPCGIAVLNARHAQVQMVAGAARCSRLHEGGVTPVLLEPLARRASIERRQLLARTYADLTAQGVRRGLHQGAAELAAIKGMQQLGYYPRPAQIVARRLSDADVRAAKAAGRLVPVFPISEMEFRVGLFQDIEAALAAPGEPVDKSMGQYITHRDYATSDALNRFLDANGRVFFVERAGRVYELTVHP
jgi:hypothetical protein